MNSAISIIEELHQEIIYCEKALQHLNASFNACEMIGIKAEYSNEELEKWEAFTARFARLADITTQKLINSILIIEKGYAGSLIDKANFAEKQGWVTKMEEFRDLRLLRNFIAHEYAKQNTNEVFELVLANYARIKNLVGDIIQYVQSNPVFNIYL